jgi:hypothetical protein
VTEDGPVDQLAQPGAGGRQGEGHRHAANCTLCGRPRGANMRDDSDQSVPAASAHAATRTRGWHCEQRLSAGAEAGRG